MNNTENWNRLPRVVRGGLLVFLGGSASFVALATSHDRDSDIHRSDYAIFQVGVGCAEKPGFITTAPALGGFTIRCVNPDGSAGRVMALGELDPEPPAHLVGYDAVIQISSADIQRGDNSADASIGLNSTDIPSDTTIITFDFSGNYGQAVIGNQKEVGPTVNNDHSNAIVRVSN